MVLKYQQMALPRKKCVWQVHFRNFKNENSDCQIVMDGYFNVH